MADARSRTLRRLAGLLRQEVPALSAATALLALGAALALAYPQGIRAIVDGALAGRDPARVVRVAFLLGGLAIFQGLAVTGRAILFALAGERGVRRVREHLFRSLVSQEVAFFDEARTGDLVSRIGTDSASLQGLLSANLSVALRNAITALGALGLLFVTSPRLTAVMLLVVPPVAIGSVFYGRKVRALARRYQDALAEASHAAEESLSSIRTVRAYVAEQIEVERFGAATGAAYQAARRRALAAGTFMGGASAGVYAAAAAVLGYGGLLVSRGELSAGALTAFLVYTLLLAMSLGALADLWAEVMRSLGAAEKVLSLIERVPAMPLSGGQRPESCRGEVRYQAVRFAYPSRPEAEVLRGVDLTIAAGEVVALVGPSGAGKTTLGALLCRLYDPGSGSVALDGRDLRVLDPGWLRSQMGVVPQEPVLFSASVEDNVRYGRPGASRSAALGWAAPAHRHRPGHPPGPAHPPPRRGHQRARRRVRGAGARGAHPAHAGTDHAGHRPPPLDRGHRRPGGGGRRRQGGRGRPPRRAPAAGGAVPQAGRAADAGDVTLRRPGRARRRTTRSPGLPSSRRCGPEGTSRPRGTSPSCSRA
jgi:ABC-type multidrug transport system fused ATPase/permease subunit